MTLNRVTYLLVFKNEFFHLFQGTTGQPALWSEHAATQSHFHMEILHAGDFANAPVLSHLQRYPAQTET